MMQNAPCLYYAFGPKFLNASRRIAQFLSQLARHAVYRSRLYVPSPSSEAHHSIFLSLFRADRAMSDYAGNRLTWQRRLVQAKPLVVIITHSLY